MERSADDQNINILCRPLDQLKDLWGNAASDDGTVDSSDDEQEDLPYDGNLERYLIPSSHYKEVNNCGDHSDLHQSLTSLAEDKEANDVTESEGGKDKDLFPVVKSNAFSISEGVFKCTTKPDDGTSLVATNEGKSKKLEFSSTIIPDVLLRHFSDDSLLNPCQFIDHETIPEISIAESSDETVINRKCRTKCSQDDFGMGQDEDFESYLLGRHENDGFGYQEENVTSESNSDVDEATSHGSDGEKSPILIQENTDLNETLIDNIDKESLDHKYELERRPSHEIKYGQGQVHYKLPDFSKVPPKVKIPKGNGPVTPMTKLKRARSSPNLMGQSVVIRDILESMQPFNDAGKNKETCQTPELLHLQEEYHTLLTKHAETKNLVDKLRVETKASLYFPDSSNDNKSDSLGSPASDCFTANTLKPSVLQAEPTEGVSQGLVEGDASETTIATICATEGSLNPTSLQVPTEGEKMSGMLREQAEQLKTKVEEFSDCLIKESLPLKEQHLVVQDLRACMEALERDYLSTKETHRDLQLQSHRTGSQTMGGFDTERELEGQIFWLGMLLEDLQEVIDRRAGCLSPAIATLLSPCDTASSTHPEESQTSVISASPDPDYTPRSPILSVRAAPERPIYEQDKVLVKGTTDSPQLPRSHHEAYHINSEASTQTAKPEFNTKNQHVTPSNTGNFNVFSFFTDSYQPTENNSSLTPTAHVGHRNSFKLNVLNKGQNRLRGENWHLGGTSEDPFHKYSQQNAERSGKDPNRRSPFVSRYQKIETEKTERRISQHGKLSIFIQEKEVNLDFSDCSSNMEDCSGSDWLISADPKISDRCTRRPRAEREEASKGPNCKCKTRERKCTEHEDYDDFVLSCTLSRNSLLTSSPNQTWNRISDTKLTTGGRRKFCMQDRATCGKEFPWLKSHWVSPIPAETQNKGTFLTKNSTKYSPMNRSHLVSPRHNFRTPLHCSSRFADPVTPSPQQLLRRRKSWPCADQNCVDNMDCKVLNSVLDQAIRTARSMKRTTERMVKAVAADLANAQSNRSFYSY